MKNIIDRLIILILFIIKFSLSLPTISLQILEDHILLYEIKLNFLFYMRYCEIISKKEFSSIYRISYISKDSNISSFYKNKDNILLFDSFSNFSIKKTNNISNIIIFPEKERKIVTKKLFLFFDLKQFIFFLEQEQFDNLIKYDFHQNEKIYSRIIIPPEISKNLAYNNENITIPEYYFILMFLSFVIFFVYLFQYNFLVPLLYKDFWLFFISQFYLFIPLRFIVLILLSIKLIVIQNIRGLLPSSPGFFVILAVQKSLIKTNFITMILLSNEGLYIFENMTKIILTMTIKKFQFFIMVVILILVYSFPFHNIIIAIDLIIFPIIIIHAIINYKQLKKALKITLLTKKKYIPFLKLKISIWIKQNILLSIYFISLIIIYCYSIFSTNKILIDEIVCLKIDMLGYCAQNIFLFIFCYLYRPRNLDRNFFIVYTERYGSLNLKFFLFELNENNNIRNKFIDKTKEEFYINKKTIENIRKKHINKPIIILNPKLFLKRKNNNQNQQDNIFNIYVGNIN